MTDLRSFAEITEADLDLVGGKGLSLGLLASAGLPVPPGFCVTTVAYRRAKGTIDPTLFEALIGAYRTLGGGSVAVRSSLAPLPSRGRVRHNEEVRATGEARWATIGERELQAAARLGTLQPTGAHMPINHPDPIQAGLGIARGAVIERGPR